MRPRSIAVLAPMMQPFLARLSGSLGLIMVIMVMFVMVGMLVVVRVRMFMIMGSFVIFTTLALLMKLVASVFAMLVVLVVTPRMIGHRVVTPKTWGGGRRA